MIPSLKNRHIVVTGAGGGLGPSVVEALQASGAICHAPSRSELDLTEESAVARYYAALPSLWASVHVAGGFAMGSAEETSLQAFNAQWQINTVTAFLCCREAVRRMKSGGPGGGRIVNVAAKAALDLPAGKLAYVTAKGALIAMTRALAAEARPAGILVNAVVPDTIDTPANRQAMPKGDFSLWTKPASIAGTLAWLVSPENESVSGALVPV
ncbi:MAG TPA: SDR family NAD(P)-dependent oxidoreductase [Fibrobacteria bacterium]|nr:SDR family NAD(P)-dependent oxidoreductase [Fibrobacteria bacterium]